MISIRFGIVSCVEEQITLLSVTTRRWTWNETLKFVLWMVIEDFGLIPDLWGSDLRSGLIEWSRNDNQFPCFNVLTSRAIVFQARLGHERLKEKGREDSLRNMLA